MSSAPIAARRRPPSVSGTDVSAVVVDGRPGTVTTARAGVGVAVGATTATGAAVGAGVAVGATVGVVVGAGVAVGAGAGVAAATTAVLTVARQVVRAPPPFVEPLH
jgi:hypothetical protein